MVRLLLFCMLASHLLTTLAMARSFPAAVQTTTIELERPSMAGFSFSHGLSPLGSVSGLAGAPESTEPMKHRPLDRSIACGEVILAGLATAIFAVIFCYIRVTRDRMEDSKS